MPAKHVVKIYKENSYYHIFNRGVAKNKIFREKQDYKHFLYYLKLYLSEVKDEFDLQGRTLKVAPSRIPNNFSDKIKLSAYCLMPNHYHLLLYQTDKYLIRDFMRSIGTKYAMFFNQKYNRVGPIFQGKYKAVLVDTEDQLIYLTKYIHRNPVNILPTGSDLEGYKYSSYGNYLGKFSQDWLKHRSILNNFTSDNKLLSYQKFVEELEEDNSIIDDCLLDSKPTGSDLEG
jgi:REP-associated tyrosine transposase